MRFLERFRKRVGAFKVKRINSKRIVKAVNIDDAKSAGIVFLVKDLNSIKFAEKFRTHLKGEEGIRKVQVLGFVDGKEIPDYINPKLDFYYFCRKDLNWHFKPVKQEVDNFVKEDFDLLIDLSRAKEIPLNFVVKKSKSKFKIGRYSNYAESLFDFMVDISVENNKTNFIKQLIHYLKLINRNESKV